MNLFDGIVSFSVLSLIASSLSFGFMLSVVSVLGLDEYGSFVLFLAISQTIEGLSSSQSWQGISRYFARGFKCKGSDRVFFTLVLTDFANVCIAVVFTYIAVSFFDDMSFSPNAGLLIFFVILPKLIAVPIGLVRVLNHFMFLGWNMILCQSLKLMGLWFLAFSSEKQLDVIDIIVLYIITEWLFILFNVVRISKDPQFRSFLTTCPSNEGKCNGLDLEVVKFQAICHANCSSVLSIRHFDEIIVGIYLTTEVLGFWKLLKMSTGMVGKILEPLYVFVFPKLEALDVKGKDQKFIMSILGKCKMYCLVFSGVIIGLLVLSVILEGYVTIPLDKILAGLVVFWVSVVNLLYFFSHPLAIRCRGEKKVLVLNLVSGSLFLSLLFTLVQINSLFLVAVALAVYCAVNHLGRLLISKSFMRINFE